MRLILKVRSAATVALAASVGFVALSAQGQNGQAGQQQQQQQQGQAGRGGGGGRGGGQQPARDTAAQTPVVGKGIIAGVITTAGTGSPVRRARVTLSGAELRGGRST